VGRHDHGGDSALQAPCGGFDSPALHQVPVGGTVYKKVGQTNLVASRLQTMTSEARLVANKFIRRHAEKVTGKVLSIGSGGDLDWEGSRYRDYFKNSSAYFTSEISPTAKTDLKVDMRDMSQIASGMFDCIFCAGTLEHVDDMFGAMAETSRICKAGGTLLLGVPFGQAIHRPPQDFWRMTIHGLYYLLERFDFELDDILTIPGTIKGFPSCYWSNSIKKSKPDD